MQTQSSSILYIEHGHLAPEWIEHTNELVEGFQPAVSQAEVVKFMQYELRTLTYWIVSVCFLALEYVFPELLYKMPDVLQMLHLPWEWALRPDVCEQTWLYVKLAAALATSGIAGCVINWIINAASLQPYPGYQSIELVEDLY